MRGECVGAVRWRKKPDDTPHVGSGQPGRPGRFDTGAMKGIRTPADPKTAPSKRCFDQKHGMRIVDIKERQHRSVATLKREPRFQNAYHGVFPHRIRLSMIPALPFLGMSKTKGGYRNYNERQLLLVNISFLIGRTACYFNFMSRDL